MANKLSILRSILRSILDSQTTLADYDFISMVKQLGTYIFHEQWNYGGLKPLYGSYLKDAVEAIAWCEDAGADCSWYFSGLENNHTDQNGQPVHYLRDFFLCIDDDTVAVQFKLTFGNWTQS